MERQTQNTTTPSFRDEIESDILQQVRNEVQEALLLHAPAEWQHEQCEAVEESVLDHRRPRGILPRRSESITLHFVPRRSDPVQSSADQIPGIGNVGGK
jgi:hypothetical protein